MASKFSIDFYACFECEISKDNVAAADAIMLHFNHAMIILNSCEKNGTDKPEPPV